MGQVKKRNENLKIFHPLLFFISLFRPCRCQIYIDSRLHIVQSPSWKVVADGGRRASGAFFATKGASETTGPKTLFGWKN